MQYTLSRRGFLQVAGGTALVSALRAQSRPPNIIVIYADDMGYGDLGCYGSRIPTPFLDQMAREGVRFTNFYSASPVCSASRAALLTGRYGNRFGIAGVLGPDAPDGLPDSETTIAQMLKGSGYATSCIGKWHLGSKADYLPTNRGFDEYFGIPYSHDMWPRVLMRNTTVIEQPADLTTLTKRYTQAAVDFIARSKNGPFFLYMPHSFPHIPLAVSPAFAGASGQGLYGDTVNELDWSVGQVLQSLKDNGLDERTLVLFSSDNGPWYQGSAGRLRGRKGESYEGGLREPMIARFPGRIPQDRICDAMATTLDILPTVAGLTGSSLPAAPLDGIDIWPLLEGTQSDLPRDAFLYFNDVWLQCARRGPWKLHVARYNTPMYLPEPPGGRQNLPLPVPELYNVVEDPEESYDRAARNPAIVADIQARIDRLIRTFPAGVVNAYEATKSRRSQIPSAGACPVAAAP